MRIREAGWCNLTTPLLRSPDEQRAQAGTHDVAWASSDGRQIEQERWRAARATEAFGIRERMARKWLARLRFEGTAGLENRSSSPGTVANRLSEPLVEVAGPAAA